MVASKGLRVAVLRRPPRARTLVVAAGCVVLVWLLFTLAHLYTDLLWFREVGKTRVFWGVLGARVLFAVSAGVGTGAFLVANLRLVAWAARRQAAVDREAAAPDRWQALLAPRLRELEAMVVAVVVLGVALHAGGKWQTLLLWRNRVPFGDTDAQFHRDIGYYTFTLPMQRLVFGWLLFTLLATLLAAGAGWYLRGGIRPRLAGRRVSAAARAHLSLLVGLVLLLKAWGYRLDQFSLVFSPRGVVTGASYTDVHAQLPALRLMVLLAPLCAVLVFATIRSRGFVLPASGLVLFGLSSILVGGVYPTIVQRFQVAPQELQRELPYIQRNLDATRKAFALDHVVTTEYAAAELLPAAALHADQVTVDNIRLWEPSVLKIAIQNLQAIGQYYEFSDVDVDRYPIGGARRQVMISARDVDPRNLDPSAQTWQNLHLTYTHGYGVVAAQVNTAEASGRPLLVVSGFDQPASGAAIPVRQPRIYYGEPPPGGPAYVVAHTRQPEADAPAPGGAPQVSFRYDGHGGIPVSGPLRRAAFALRFRDINLLISSNLTAGSRIILYRDVRRRLQKAAPFLQWDGDPYVAVVDGRIVFIRDGYTTTDAYPYAERIQTQMAAHPDNPGGQGVHGRANYIRNSVKAVVDAYDGTVTLYAFDQADPLLRVWRRAFPGLFAPRSAISADLQAHLRYPEDLFAIQANRYASYHIPFAKDFYSKQDFWAIPEDRSGPIRPSLGAAPLPLAVGQPRREPMRPYYLLARLPGESREHFVLVLPFTPNNKQNMVAYLAVRADPDGYGTITLFNLPRSRTVFGPTQVNAQILADPNVAKELTLFNQQGSTVTLGNLLTVPVGDALLYAQPIFIQASQGAIPQLRRVAAFLNGDLGYTATLEGSLAQILGEAPPSGPTPGPGGPGPPAGTALARILAQEAEAFRQAQAALDRKDLGAYQRAIDRLGELIRQAQQLTSAGAPPATSAAPASTTPTTNR
jgi:uncharacterized membrane protein (UPF0182 family)